VNSAAPASTFALSHQSDSGALHEAGGPRSIYVGACRSRAERACSGGGTVAAVLEQVRIDKWLWAARFFKTRRAATEAVLGGHVHVNHRRAKPAKEVRVSDTVEVRVGDVKWTVVVNGVADRRGPASVATTLYQETPASIADRERSAAERRLARPPWSGLGARPTKQARRRIEALRRAHRDYPANG
jgi:ribosome-associated heat shock protein Hsp15